MMDVEPVGVLLTVLGVVLVGVGFADAIITTTAIAEFPGPLTRVLSVSLWRGFKMLSSRSDSALLRAAGSLVILSVISAWVATIWLGWALIFAGSPGAVVHGETGQAASFASVIYFTATSVATTGVGDFVPATDGWRLLTGLVSVSGIALITLGVTYLVPIIQAGVNRQHLAHRLNTLGSSPHDILMRGFDGSSFDRLVGRFPGLTDELTQLRAEHLAYPVLQFLHGARLESALAPRVAALDEALTLLEHGVGSNVNYPAGELLPLREAIDALLETMAAEAVANPTAEAPYVPSLEPLRKAGIPTVADAALDEALLDASDRRNLLLAYVRDDGWLWEDVYRDV